MIEFSSYYLIDGRVTNSMLPFLFDTRKSGGLANGKRVLPKDTYPSTISTQI